MLRKVFQHIAREVGESIGCFFDRQTHEAMQALRFIAESPDDYHTISEYGRELEVIKALKPDTAKTAARKAELEFFIKEAKPFTCTDSAKS